jgi:hypothetical protein
MLKSYWKNYTQLSLLAGWATAGLFITLLIAPGVIHWLFQIESNPSAIVMSRRAAMLFLGLSTVIITTRNTTDTQTQSNISLAIALSMSGLFLIGCFDLLRGNVGWGISLALIPEAFLASGYFYIWKATRNS